MKPLAIDLFCGLGGWADNLRQAMEAYGMDCYLQGLFDSREVLDVLGQKP